MQIGGACDRVGFVMQNSGEIDQVVAVPLNLGDGVKAWSAGCTLNSDQFTGPVVEGGLAPLLQLNDHVGRGARARMTSGEDHVNPLAGQRQLMLEKHLDVLQPSVENVLSQYRQAPRPRVSLCR